MTNLPAAKIAHAQALVAWNGMEYADAMKLAESQTCEQLESQSYANVSIAAAKAGIEKYLLGGKKIDERYLTGAAQAPEGYFEGLRTEIDSRLDTKALGKGVMSILDDIHTQWVSDNAKKYNRDAEKNDRRLYQHLPTHMIGVHEVALDAMFLAPILYKMGIYMGAMEQKPYGTFIPSPGFTKVYHEYSKEHLGQDVNEVKLRAQITNAINEYAPLQGQDELSKARRAYMTERTDLLVTQTVKNLGLENIKNIDNGRTL